jgi:hypothetical protein
VDTKGHFPSTIRAGLGGVPYSPVAAREIPPQYSIGGRPISDDEVFDGVVFYRGHVYDFGFFPRTYRDDPDTPEYYVSDIDEARADPHYLVWSLLDYPDLVFRLIELPRVPYDDKELESLRAHGYDDPFTWWVTDAAMVSFLQRFGPLTRSDVDPENPYSRDGWLADFRDLRWACLFSEPVLRLRQVVEVMESGDPTALPGCLQLIDESPKGTLYRALLLDLLERILQAERPRRCAGCGKWFVLTEDASQATHRRGWKRRDSRYHSARCRKAALERERRRRMRDQRVTSKIAV